MHKQRVHFNRLCWMRFFDKPDELPDGACMRQSDQDRSLSDVSQNDKTLAHFDKTEDGLS
tara:strand:- start:765 stop:944 length:180 start_codon:yes stop_codon:yes gene_type:complete